MGRYLKFTFLFFCAICLFSCNKTSVSDQKTFIENTSGTKELRHDSRNSSFKNTSIEKNDEVPDYVLEILTYIRINKRAPRNYVGGRIFYNREKRLPILNENSQKINYREWDVHEKVKGVNRGPERLITSEETAYYTKDHYKTFIYIKEIH